jgi:serine phosphatase RsbU (regulator of sigma subunit)/CheY-like chemotaxis protein
MSSEEAEPQAQRADILVVEDSPTQALQLRHLLQQSGHRVTVAANADQALQRLQESRPDLIISDIIMPGADGYELCRRIKADAALATIPVMLLTTMSDPTDVIRGLEAGANAFATKPYKGPALLRRVADILVNRDMKSPGAQGEDGQVFFAGRKHAVALKPQQTIEFLLYTYEDAVEKNLDLIEARDAISRSNRDLANYASQLQARNAQMEDDIRMARDIQRAFLPHAYPRFPASSSAQASRLRFAHLYQPSTTLGGDFFAVLPVSDLEAGVFVCDVVGHGLRAALVTAIIRGLVEDLTPVAGEPGRFLTELNRNLAAVFSTGEDAVFASAVYAVIDAAHGNVRYANAGHPWPLRLSPSAQTVTPLRAGEGNGGPALGLFGDNIYPMATSDLDAGDVIVFFTDGVFEAKNAEQQEFGEDRLRSALQCSIKLHPKAMFEGVLAEIRAFTGAAGFEDDVCLVAAELVNPEESHGESE